MADCIESVRAKILADLNLAVQYGIVIRIIYVVCVYEILADFNFVSTAKQPNLILHQIFQLNRMFHARVCEVTCTLLLKMHAMYYMRSTQAINNCSQMSYSL